MKKLVLEKILLKSDIEKKARKIEFDKTTTIVLGENDTGKSSLLKSIYWTFGADSTTIHQRWKELHPTSVVEFTLDGVKYSLLRRGRYFAIFDSNNTLIRAFNSITNELAPFLADLFNFKLKMISREGSHETPLPPAFLFLPFYIDQDSSWNSNWSSFGQLGQFQDWRKGLVEYHAGIKDNEFFDLKNKKTLLSNEVKTHEIQLDLFEKNLEEFKIKEGVLEYNIDVEVFKKEVDELLQRVGGLQKIEEKLKNELTKLYNIRFNIESQIRVVEKAKKEIDQDYGFALKQDEEVECPTCGTNHKNSFAERFSLAQDQSRCVELLSELKLELLETIEKIKIQENSVDVNDKDISGINRILNEKRGLLSLNDIIKNEGHKQFKQMVEMKISDIKLVLSEKRDSVKIINNKIKEYDNTRANEIKDYYLNNMRVFLGKLGVMNFTENMYKNIACHVKETGSDLPRALLAYYFSILRAMKKYSSSTFAAIIIDSPNQQAQDRNNIKKILQFIKEEQIEDSQLILALEDLYGIEYGGKLIKLDKKDSLLLEEEYASVSKEIMEFEKISILKKID